MRKSILIVRYTILTMLAIVGMYLWYHLLVSPPKENVIWIARFAAMALIGFAFFSLLQRWYKRGAEHHRQDDFLDSLKARRMDSFQDFVRRQRGKAHRTRNRRWFERAETSAPAVESPSVAATSSPPDKTLH